MIITDAPASLVGLVTWVYDKLRIKFIPADEPTWTIGPAASTLRTAMLQHLKSLNCVDSSKRIRINCVNVGQRVNDFRENKAKEKIQI